VIPAELNDFDAARATRASIDDVRSWKDGKTDPGSYAISRLRDVHQVVQRLEALGLNDPQTRGEWLRTPNRAFDQDAPLDVIARGDHDTVVAYIDKVS